MNYEGWFRITCTMQQRRRWRRRNRRAQRRVDPDRRTTAVASAGRDPTATVTQKY